MNARGGLASVFALSARLGAPTPRLAQGCCQRVARLPWRGLRPVRTRLAPAPAVTPVWETDAYDHDLGYDSDDYELPAPLPQRPAASSGSSGVAPAAAVRAAPAAAVGAEQQAGPGEGEPQAGSGAAQPLVTPAAALSTAALVGHAVLLFLQRIQQALVATGTAAFLLLQQAAREGAVQARALSVTARRSLRRSKAGEKVKQMRERAQSFVEQLPEGFWGKLLWLWDRPPVQKLRLTWSLANISIKLPAVLALVATQVGLLASQVSLPMLAPLLLGTGMLLRSVRSNASFLLPRLGLFVVLAWLLWFANSVVQSTVAYLRRQGAIDNRIASAVITASECSAVLGALLILLSMLGINIGSALLLPAGIAVAIAAKDLLHNWVAGFFLFVAQPFRMGDRVAVSFSAPGAPGAFTSNWFEGVCEKIDLRYTMIRQGSRRLMVPNSAFLTREFMILDDMPLSASRGDGGSPGEATAAGPGGSYPSYPGEAFGAPPPGAGGRPQQEQAAWVQMQSMMASGPYHQELLGGVGASGGAAAAPNGSGSSGPWQPQPQPNGNGGGGGPPYPSSPLPQQQAVNGYGRGGAPQESGYAPPQAAAGAAFMHQSLPGQPGRGYVPGYNTAGALLGHLPAHHNPPRQPGFDPLSPLQGPWGMYPPPPSSGS